MLEALAANPLFNDQVGGRYEQQQTQKKLPVDKKQPDFVFRRVFLRGASFRLLRVRSARDNGGRSPWRTLHLPFWFRGPVRRE